ncbi:ricin B-like lectin [Cutaneotrichosporon oleaginosum]|uniref:Ricin B-like lectin n=1 Tax=Cutaneotrichosporon oleaginosum TaxID=879819 RepID=A0A0J0XFN5_9TREE|nr:ricin B-like lectin [Cutaneotrichosporon oleaginosum]KLT39871.1 ricin B-like lectin [Cutaneotrichosporon oleaginosum]TXT05468.1 hypothetical protein COLE_06788 [Cutaneotrichosporon oleaginosum]
MLTALFALLAATATLGAQIHPRGDTRFCLQATDAPKNGDVVSVNTCNGSRGQDFTISPGSTKVKVAGSNFCLDAGSSPGNGIRMKVWQCYDGLPAQQFYLTGDGRIAVEGKGQCLDLTNGNLVALNPVQTWECGTGNNNQYWTVGGGGPGPTTVPPTSVPPSCAPSTVTVTVTRAAAKRENRYQH